MTENKDKEITQEGVLGFIANVPWVRRKRKEDKEIIGKSKPITVEEIELRQSIMDLLIAHKVNFIIKDVQINKVTFVGNKQTEFRILGRDIKEGQPQKLEVRWLDGDNITIPSHEREWEKVSVANIIFSKINSYKRPSD